MTELSLALAREYPEDTYQLLSDQSFALPSGAPVNLSRGTAPGEPVDRRWWLWGIRRAMAKSGAQIFHGTNFEVPYLGRTPAILTIHDLSPWRNPAWHDLASRVRVRTPWLLRFRRACMILTVSEAVRREVISFFGVPAEKVRAVPLAASERFRPVAQPQQNHRRPFFLFVGTLEPRKNVHSVVEAWSKSRQQTGADLIIAGRRRSDFVPIAGRDGLTLPGEVPDDELPRLYSEALAFVYPTHYEGFGLPVLEAMQCGAPVITSRDPAVMEVCGGAALHTEGIEEMAEAMTAITARPELRMELKRSGLVRSARFSWQSTARATHALYVEILANRAGERA